MLGLGEGSDKIDRTLVMSPPADSMKLWLVARRPETREARPYLIKEGDFEDLSAWAEDYAGQRGNAVLAAKARNWRQQPASEGQVKFARRLGVWQNSMNKGTCAEAITRALALRTLERGGYA